MPPKKQPLIDFSNPNDVSIVIDQLIKNNKNMNVLKQNRLKLSDVPKEELKKLKEIKNYIDSIIGLTKAVKTVKEPELTENEELELNIMNTPAPKKYTKPNKKQNWSRGDVFDYYNKFKSQGITLKDAWAHFRKS
jgi:hypothetical protein